MSKGDNPRPKSVPLSEFDANHAKVFKAQKPQAGRWRMDRETGKLIPASEWWAKYGEEGNPSHFVQGDIEPYISPTTGRYITSRRQHKYGLDASGCRVYEGREQEVKEANRYQKEQEKKLESIVERGVEKTYYELRDGMARPADKATFEW